MFLSKTVAGDVSVFTEVGFKNMHYKDACIWIQPHTTTVPVSHCNQDFNVIYKKIELFTFATYLMASSFITTFESVRKWHTNSLRVNFSMISITVQEKYLKHCEFLLFCSIIQTHSLQHMHLGLTVSRIPFQIKAQKLHHISRDSPTFLHVAFQYITIGITLIPMSHSTMCPLTHF